MIIDFFINQKSVFENLQNEQNAWYERERRLISYRKDHLDEVNQYFDEIVSKYAPRVNNNEKILKKLNKLKTTFISAFQKEMTFDYFISKFKILIEKVTSSSLPLDIPDNDEDINGIIIKHCPRCNAPVENKILCCAHFVYASFAMHAIKFGIMLIAN